MARKTGQCLLVDRDAREASPDEWDAWRSKADRQVALSEVAPGPTVSTILIGLNFSFRRPDGPPLLLETRTFNAYGDAAFSARRHATWSEAEAGHLEVVSEVRARLSPG